MSKAGQVGSSMEVSSTNGYTLRAIPLEHGMVMIEADDGISVTEIAVVSAPVAASFAVCLRETAITASAGNSNLNALLEAVFPNDEPVAYVAVGSADGYVDTIYSDGELALKVTTNPDGTLTPYWIGEQK